jgi:hypothetical protein
MVTNSFGNKKFQAANERTQNTLKGAQFSPPFRFWGVGVSRERIFVSFMFPMCSQGDLIRFPRMFPIAPQFYPKTLATVQRSLYIQVVRGGQRADSIGDYPMLPWYVVPGLTFVSHLLIHITKWNWYRRSGTGDDQMSHLRKTL